MAVAWQASGAIAADATTTNLAITAPACAADDILIASIFAKSDQVISAPDGTWTNFCDVIIVGTNRFSLFWKRATASGGTFTFTKPVDDNILFCGMIAAFRGCLTSATPIDATAPSESTNASSDTVTYADFDPTETDAFVVASSCYGNDLTTAGAIAGTDPTFTNQWDLETATGSDASLFGYSGSSTGAATGARSHSTTSTADAGSHAVLFGLIAAPASTDVFFENQTDKIALGDVALTAAGMGGVLVE